jgi:hypothetical protein
MKIIYNVSSEELKEILQEHKLIGKHKDIDETGHKTTYYVVTKKSNEDKCEEVREMNPFNTR